jgi:hypothetical protein
MVRAYDRRIDGQTLEFRYDNGSTITDIQTKMCGILMEKPRRSVRGENLARLLFDEGFWFE